MRCSTVRNGKPCITRVYYLIGVLDKRMSLKIVIIVLLATQLWATLPIDLAIVLLTSQLWATLPIDLAIVLMTHCNMDNYFTDLFTATYNYH